jgi:hypothetical protein
MYGFVCEQSLTISCYSLGTPVTSKQTDSIKSSRAHSRVNWLQKEIDVSGNISVPIIRVVCDSSLYIPARAQYHATTQAISTVTGQVYRGNAWGIQSHHNPDDRDRDSSRNVGFFLQPIDAAVCSRRFY